MKTTHYTSEIEEGMQLFAATLNERDFRRYAAIEALKLEHGGISYISKLLSIDNKTISKGIKYQYSYCSKYNPIEHKLFPHVTRALSGVVLDSVQTVKALIESRAKTKKGLETYVNIVDKVYETGKKASEWFLENMPIVFDQFLPKWNYKAVPIL